MYGKHLQLGSDIMINYNCDILDSNIVTIGNRVLIGPDVKIFAGNHSLNPRERFRRLEDGVLHVITVTQPVTIGDDVWIGGGAIILPGVTIGNNVVIGAGSVVTKDIPDNCIAVGNPAKVLTLKSLNVYSNHLS